MFPLRAIYQYLIATYFIPHVVIIEGSTTISRRMMHNVYASVILAKEATDIVEPTKNILNTKYQRNILNI